jgi:hypothetical protein
MNARHLAAAGSAALTCVALSFAAPGAAVAAVKDCDLVRYHSESPAAIPSISTILNVRNTTCGAALRVVKRHGNTVGKSAYVRGGTFRLGRYRCKVYAIDYESRKARCTSGRKAFRVDYGS